MERDGGHAQTLEYEYGDPHYDPERNVWSTDYGFALQDPNYVRDGNTTFQRTYEWNERNLLKRSRDQQYTVHYRYGVDGQRALKFTEQNNKEQLYFNKMYQMSSGEGFSGNWVESKHIYVGETRIVTARNEAGNDNTAYQERNQFFYHSDHLGSAQLVTDYNGRTYERIEYTPYGESWIEWKDYSENNYVTPFRFTSKEKDMETGLYYYGARYLDAKTSRWMSADPALGEYVPTVGGDNSQLPGMGGIYNYVNMHLYHYAGNNPVKYLDPNGMWTDNGDGTFTAQQDDTLWGLAEEQYGDGSRWQEFGYEGDPTKLQIGESVGQKNEAPSAIAEASPAPVEPSSIIAAPGNSNSINTNSNVFSSWWGKADGADLTDGEAALQIAIGGVEMGVGIVGGFAAAEVTAGSSVVMGMYLAADGGWVLSEGINGKKATPGTMFMNLLLPPTIPASDKNSDIPVPPIFLK